MATKKKKNEEPLVPPVQTEDFSDVPEIKDTIEEAVVTGEMGALPTPAAPASTDVGNGLAGNRPAPQKPLQTPTAPASTDLGGGLVGNRPEPQRPAIQPESETPAQEEETETPTAEQPEASSASNTEGPKETAPKSEAEEQPVGNEGEQEAKPDEQGSASPEAGQEMPKVNLSPEELAISQRAAADAILKAPTNTAETLAKQNGVEALEANKPDPAREAFVNAQEQDRRSFADLIQGMRDDYEREREAARVQLEADNNAAKYTGYTELGAAIANLIGVGNGNAVSQTYKPFSQDWMKKADQDMREHRSRIDNLRQRQRDTEFKMAQMKSQQGLERAKFNMQLEQRRFENAYKKAQIAYQQARTEAARQKAQQDAAKAQAEIARIQAQVAAYEAQARQRDASARASLQNAATRRLGQENQNRNRDLTSAAQANANDALAYQRRQKADGVVQPNPAAQQGNPAVVGGANKEKNTGLGAYK